MTNARRADIDYFGGMMTALGFTQVLCERCGGVVFVRTVKDGQTVTACKQCGEPRSKHDANED